MAGSTASSSNDDTVESLELEIDGLDSAAVVDTESYLAGGLTPYSDQRTFNILRAFLHPESRDHTPLTVSRAVLMITNMLPDAPREDGRADELLALWALVARVAEQIPQYHTGMLRLVRLVERLGESPKTAFVGKDEDGCDRMRRVYLLGEVLRDGFQPPNANTSDDVGAWINRSTFMALLYSFGIVDGRQLALWQLRLAFEEPPNGPKDQVNRARAAACWILHAGEMVVRMVVEPGDVTEADRRTWRKGELYRGRSGYSLDRWIFWKKGFANVGGSQEVVDYMNMLEKTVEL